MRTPAVLLILLLVSLPALATTLGVPDPYPTIQAAIDACSSGDTVLVADGVYSSSGFEDINYGGRNIVVRSENGAVNTILDIDNGRGFLFASGETEEAVLDGFTITNGSLWEGIGAGIWCTDGSSPTIRNCLVAHHDVVGLMVGRGGGIACTGGASPVLEGCTVTGNIATCDAGGLDGGGIWCYRASATLYRCIFWGNCEGDVVAHDSSSTITLICCAVDPEGVGGAGVIEFVGENVLEDPLFCDPQPCYQQVADPWWYTLNVDSPCLPDVSPCGVLIGALPIGCPQSHAPSAPGVLPSLSLSRRGASPVVGVIQWGLTVGEACRVRVAAYDVAGCLRGVVLDRWLHEGFHPIDWEPTGLPSGVYVLEARTEDQRTAHRCLVLR